MQWSDVMKAPPPKLLRQFAGLWLVFFPLMAALRVWRGHADNWAVGLAVIGVVIGLIGLAKPEAMRPIYTGWMIAAFPIGWTVSQLMLVVLFYGVFTPVGLVFRVMRRDALALRRRNVVSYWAAKEQPASAQDYFRQF
jgi:hypothetical protein